MAKEPEQQIFFGDMPMHELFQKQVQQVIAYLQGRATMRFFFARGDQVIYADLWGTP